MYVFVYKHRIARVVVFSLHGTSNGISSQHIVQVRKQNFPAPGQLLERLSDTVAIRIELGIVEDRLERPMSLVISSRAIRTKPIVLSLPHREYCAQNGLSTTPSTHHNNHAQ